MEALREVRDKRKSVDVALKKDVECSDSNENLGKRRKSMASKNEQKKHSYAVLCECRSCGRFWTDLCDSLKDRCPFCKSENIVRGYD